MRYTIDKITNRKVKALQKHFGEVDMTKYRKDFPNYFYIDGQEYFVVTEEERWDELKRILKTSLSSYGVDMLSRYTEIPEKILEGFLENASKSYLEKSEILYEVFYDLDVLGDFMSDIVDTEGFEVLLDVYASTETYLGEDLFAYREN